MVRRVLFPIFIVGGLVVAALGAFGLIGFNHPAKAEATRLPRPTPAAIDRALARSTAPAAVRSPYAGPPIRVEIPLLGKDAPVVTIAGSGTTLEPPASASILAWSDTSSVAGAASGTTLVIGHINWAGAVGVFADIGSLHPGDLIEVETRLGWIRYRMAVSGEFPKGDLPPQVFTHKGPPVLALVTCGGAYDAVTHSYDDNVVVLATPV